MFEEIYDSVISSLSRSGFISWSLVNNNKPNLLKSVPMNTDIINYGGIKKLPSNLKIKTFNYSQAFHTTHFNTLDLNDIN